MILLASLLLLAGPARVEHADLRSQSASSGLAATYRALVNRHHVVKSHGWMVGNSPRSDINPALVAGLNAVFIPHPATWALEHEEVRSGAGRLLILTSFRALRDHF